MNEPLRPIRLLANAALIGIAMQCMSCAPAVMPPRPLGPLSLGDVRTAYPLFRWELAPGTDGAVLELCRDRACARPFDTLRVSGSSIRASRPLRPRSVVFWRLRGLAGAAQGRDPSATWEFHVLPGANEHTGCGETGEHAHADFDGDGRDDVAISSPHSSDGERSDVGRIQIAYGEPSARPLRVGPVLVGMNRDGHFGAAVASAGDINGDGFGDLVVGAPDSSEAELERAGSFSVFYGGIMGIATSAGQSVKGTTAYELLGSTVARGGDVNSDGYADVVVSAPGGRSSNALTPGIVRVYYGSAMGLRTSDPTVLEGRVNGANFGHSIMAVADLNDDGFNELVVGGVVVRANSRLSQATSIFRGSSSGLAVNRIDTDPGPVTEERGAMVFVGCGWSVQAIHVGGSDISPARDHLHFVHLASPTAEYSIRMIERHPAGFLGADASFGASLAFAADLNGDGVGDLIVGAPTAKNYLNTTTGAVVLMFSSQISPNTANYVQLYGSQASARFGHSVATGDFNGDGYDDAIVGAPLSGSNAGPGVGAAYVYLGGRGWLSDRPAQVLEGVAMGDEFATAIAN